MKTINDVILDYLSSFYDSLKNNGPVKSFIDSWACLTLLAQININRHSYKNKNDREKLDFLFKDYGKNIIPIFKDKASLSNIENIHSILESGCPILITKFEDIKEATNNIEKFLEIAASSGEKYENKELNYFMECLVALIHLGKNRLFKSFSLDSLSNHYEEYDIKFCENAARLIFGIIKAIMQKY